MTHNHTNHNIDKELLAKAAALLNKATFWSCTEAREQSMSAAAAASAPHTLNKEAGQLSANFCFMVQRL